MDSPAFSMLGLAAPPESPLMDLTQLCVKSEKIIILAASQLHNDGAFYNLFPCVQRLMGTVTVSLYFPNERRLQQRKLDHSAELAALLKSSDLLADFYFELAGGDIAGYHSARDDFCVIATKPLLLSHDQIDRFDAAFAAHLLAGGVGFGDAGNKYIQKIIAQMPSSRRHHFRVRDRQQ